MNTGVDTMITAFYYFLCFMGIILIVVLGFFLVPLKYQIEFIYKDGYCITGIVHVGKLYGLKGSRTHQGQQLKLIMAGLTLPLNRIDPKVGRKVKKRLVKNRFSSGSFSVSKLLKTLKDEGLIEQNLHLLRDIFNIIKPHSFHIHGRVGFDEPHYTAWMLGLLGIFQGANVVSSIKVEPVWDGEFMEIDLLIAGKIVLGDVLSKLCRLFMKNWDTLEAYLQ